MSEENNNVSKFKMSVKERIDIVSILPTQGNFIELSIANDIREKVKLLQKEIAEIGLKVVPVQDGQSKVEWDPNKEKEKEITFTELEFDLIIKILTDLEKTSKLNENTFVFYKRFVKKD